MVSGRVRDNEDLYDAATRECFEETGLHIAPSFVEKYEAMRGDRTMLVNVFAATTNQHKVNISNEHQAYQWLSLIQFKKQCAFDRLVTAATFCLQKLKTTNT